MINLLQLTHQSAPHILHHYGGSALFVLLALGIFGLPIPDETLLLFAGYLIAKGKLDFITTFIAAVTGSCVGISISYGLGYLVGKKVLIRYRNFFHLKETFIIRAHDWFNKIGVWFLFFGYYIPGFRHLSGLFAGMTYLTPWRFALFAFSGAILWTSTFLFGGYYFSLHIHHYIHVWFH